MLSHNQEAFLALTRAGLWEKDVRLSQSGDVDFDKVYRFAQEQTVIGLVAAGLEHAADIYLSKDVTLDIVSETLQLEQRSLAMNTFVDGLIKMLYSGDIYTILMKGQGIAQCYERPLWRATGDVDLFLNTSNYERARLFLSSIAEKIEDEDKNRKHLAMVIESWLVELHGSLRCGLWRKLDRELEDVQRNVFCEGAVRSWNNNNVPIFLLRADEDVIYVFSHILQHFFQEGIGLRQVCDWCRLLWIYKESLDKQLLETRIKQAGIETEWKTFASFAVNRLGMPLDAMPFFSADKKWERKADKVLDFIFQTGNFGRNRDYSYYRKYPYFVFKVISLCRHTIDTIKYSFIFPFDSMLVWTGMIRKGFLFALRGR